MTESGLSSTGHLDPARHRGVTALLPGVRGRHRQLGHLQVTGPRGLLGGPGYGGDDQKLRWIRTLRGYWVGIGAPWTVPEARPAEWGIVAQLSGLPAEWR
jgi:hypothetical protein